MRDPPVAFTVTGDVVSSLPTSIRARLQRDPPLAVAVTLAVLVAGLAKGVGVSESLAGAALCVPLAWRSRRPLPILGVIAGGGLLYVAFVNAFPAPVAPLAVAVYTVAVQGNRRRTLAVGAGIVVYAAGISTVFSPEDGGGLQQTLELGSQLGLALAVGEAVRSRRALIGALRERAEEAERGRELEAERRVAEERVRIVREVHDVVAHSLATIATQSSVGVHLAGRDPERAVEVLGEVKKVSIDALHELRQALATLRDDEVEAPTRPVPSLQAVPELVGLARRSGLPVVLRMEGSPAALPATLQLAVYRIVQEGLTNVMRHAGGAQATVKIAVAGGQVEVDVTDDGTGEPTALSANGSGSGLIGMRERSRSLGGAFEAGRVAGGGFRVRAVLPLLSDDEPA